MRGLVRVLPLLVLGIVGCGGVSDSERFQLRTPGTEKTVVREIAGSQKIRTGKPTKDEVTVIRGWADALRAGHVSAAAQFFALPALVADGVNPLHSLTKRTDVVNFFNNALPCGAKLVNTRRGESSFVIATFKLTERPGPGDCGTAVGNPAYTAFLIERRHIVQWRRALPPPKQPASSGSSG
jgi:hypothetical protein